MKALLKFIAPALCVSFAASVCSAQTLTHRYAFDNNATDDFVLNSLNGTLSTTTANTIAPVFTSNTPTGANTSFADGSIELGATKVFNSGPPVSATGQASFVNFGTPAIFDGESGSWSLWFNPAAISPGAGQELFSNVAIGSGTSLRVNLAGTGAITVIGPTGVAGNVTPATVTNGSWNHLALTWDDVAGSGTLGLNGAVQTYTFTAGSLLNPARLILGNFAISNTNMLTQFVGEIYDLQIYDGALSSAQISQLNANPGTAIPEPSTAAMLIGALGVLAYNKRRRTA